MPQGAGERVVFAVVGGVLEVVASADGVFAVVVLGFVVVEVDLTEEPVYPVLEVLGYGKGRKGSDALPLVVLELTDHFCGILVY